MADELTIGIVTDLHFGPEARWQGKLRKLTAQAGDLTRDFVRQMNDEVRPDLVVNLGDDIEDESREADLRRYGECQGILRGARAELVNVAGNHDLIHLNREDMCRFWQHPGPLYYSFDQGGWHFTVLHTIEKQDVEIRVPEDFMGKVMGDLSSRRGKILGMDTDGAFQVIKAHVPTKELYHYSSTLRSLTGGRGVHAEEFSHYEEMPREAAEKVIAEAAKRKANHDNHEAH